MKHRFIVLSIILLFSGSAFSQGEINLAGGRSAAMANSSVMSSDLWSVYHNQAGMANIDDISFGIDYSTAFAMINMSFKSMALAVPVKFGTFGVNLAHYGYVSYGETRVGLGFAKAFGDKISMGINMNYFHVSQLEAYGNSGALFAEVGILSEPIDNLYIGAHVFNPTRSRLTSNDDAPIPTVIRFGLGYNFSDKALVTIETEKDLDFKLAFKAGLEFNLLKNLHLRTGISSAPENKYAFGIGYELVNFKADFAFSYHYILGFTPGLSLSYAFGKKPPAENE